MDNKASQCPDKSTYAVKRTIKLKTDGAPDIMKQEWIVIDCEKQEEAEDNYSNMQRQKLTEHALYCKNGAAMYTVLYGQLHSDIITIAKRSTVYTTMHKERDVVGLLSILCDICVQNLTGTKVDPYLEQLRILTSTLSCAQKRAYSITILVMPFMTRFLQLRVSVAHSHLEKTVA